MKTNKFIQKGFTLIELLIVIAVIGVLAAVVIAAIDPVDKIRAANDSKVTNDVGQLASSSEAYAASHNGFYPTNQTDLSTSGELKSALIQPGGYAAYVPVPLPAGCIAGSTCTSISWYGQLRSEKYTATPRRLYSSSNGKTCDVATTVTVCP